MRVITGTARGRRLRTLDGDEVRPTTDRVKEAMFSIVQFELEGRVVADLFAGSGQLGIEALSRGACLAVFTDKSAEAVKIVRENLANTQLSEKARVLQTEAAAFLSGRVETIDVALLDPPYSKGILDSTLPLLAPHMAPDGVILCEARRGDPMPEAAGAFTLRSTYRYGDTIVGLYRATPV